MNSKFHRLYKHEDSLNVQDDHGPRAIGYRAVNVFESPHPGVFLNSGFGADCYGPRAEFLLQQCLNLARRCVVHTPSDLNRAEATKGMALITDWSFGRSLADAEQVFINTTEGPQIVVGSSLGAIPALYLAQKYPDRVKGLLLVAPGTDIDRDMVGPLFEARKSLRARFLQQGYFDLPLPPISLGKPIKAIRITGEHMQAARDVCGRMKKEGIVLDCPLVIVHGHDDPQIKFSSSQELLADIQAPSKTLEAVPRVGHTVDADPDLPAMWYRILPLLSQHKAA